MKKIVLSSLFIISVFAISAQQNIYIDATNGNNANDGHTTATAWRTIQKACDSATAGSTVQIRGGTYHENLVVNVSGTSGSPITFVNYNNETVIIDGTGTTGATMLRITDRSHLSFQNLIIQNLTKADAQGILVETTTGVSTGLSFKNILIKNINWTSSAATIPTSSNNAQGFIAYGRVGGITDITIDSCEVTGCILGFSEAMTLDGNVSGFAIRHCLIHDNTNIGILIGGNYQVSSNPATDHARNGTVSDNTCYKNVSNYATSGGIYVDGGRSVVIERNKCYENGWGIELGCEQNGITDSVTVRDNLIYDNRQAGMAVGGYTTATTGQVTNCLIRNNTFFQNNSLSDGTGELDISKTSNCSFSNNIFYTNAQAVLSSIETISPQANNSFDYNCWYTPSGDSTNITVNWRGTAYTTYTGYTSGTHQDSHSIFADPTIMSTFLSTPDLHIAPTSPCVDRGNPATVIRAGETDYDGNNRIHGNIIDIGAYEYGLNTGIADLIATDGSSISIYPDPAHSTLHIVSPTAIGHITIYAITGQAIREIETSKNKASIYIADLPSGIYMIRIGEGNDLRSYRFVKE